MSVRVRSGKVSVPASALRTADDWAALGMSRTAYLRQKYGHLTSAERAARIDELSYANYMVSGSRTAVAEAAEVASPTQVSRLYHYTNEAGMNVSVPRTALRSADDVYGGVRQASKYLQELGVPRNERLKILGAFDEGTVSFRQAGNSEYGLRYFTDSSHAGGSWLFETFPASRASLAVKPEWNAMTGFRQFQIVPGTPIIQGRAAAQGPYLPGGQMQKFIYDWRSGLIQP